jgi:hypothetical protein
MILEVSEHFLSSAILLGQKKFEGVVTSCKKPLPKDVRVTAIYWNYEKCVFDVLIVSKEFPQVKANCELPRFGRLAGILFKGEYEEMKNENSKGKI